MSITSPWLIVVNEPDLPTIVTLYCFPHAGGNPSTFVTWRNQMPRDFEVLSPLLPGRLTRFAELPLTSISELADQLTAVIRVRETHEYALFGHCTGALVAFEVARRMEAEGESPPKCLFVSSHSPPHVPHAEPFLYQLDDAELIRALRQMNGTPSDVLANDELMDLILPTIRADFQMCEEYEFKSLRPLQMPIIAFAGEGDSSMEEWRDHTSGLFMSYEMEGAAFTYIGAPTLALIVEQELRRLIHGH